MHVVVFDFSSSIPSNAYWFGWCFQDTEARVCAIAWAPNNLKLAVCTTERIVLLFDENGIKRDKFPTKPCDSKVIKAVSKLSSHF